MPSSAASMISQVTYNTTGSYTNCSTIWPLWVECANQAITTSGNNFTQYIWANWYNAVAIGSVTSAGQYYIGQERQVPVVETATQARERERIVAEVNALEGKRKAADAVAEKLLFAHLGEDQRAQFQKTRYFEIITSKTKRRYRIKEGWAGNVQVLDQKGKVIETLCIHPSRQVPYADNLLAQKLLLESDEDLFRRTANITKIA